MKNIAFIFLLGIFNQAIACPEIEGTWKSSAELSNRFNESYAILTDGIKELNSQIYGNSVMTFKSGVVTLESLISQVTIDGETHEWDGSYEGTYEILGCTEGSIVLKLKVENLEYLSLIQFNKENTMWIYNGYLFDTGNGHSREYFVRQ